MYKRVCGLVLLIVMMICGISLSVTYSKYLLSKSIDGEIKVPEVDYCIRNNITSLSECMLIMGNSNEYKSLAAAKMGISAKQADFTVTAPLINYVLQSTEISNDSGLFTALVYVLINGSSIVTDTSDTGIFKFSGKIDSMSEDYVGYYTCGGYFSQCTILYRIDEVKYIESLGVYRVVKATKYYYNAIDADALSGSMYSSYTNGNYYVRPVINLRSDIKITQGNGTADNPYVVTL